MSPYFVFWSVIEYSVYFFLKVFYDKVGIVVFEIVKNDRQEKVFFVLIRCPLRRGLKVPLFPRLYSFFDFI